MLFDRLNKLITGTHKNRLPYKPGLHLYPTVDRYSDQRLRSIYSGKAFDLEELLESDAEIDRLRIAAISTFTAIGLSAEEISDQMDLIEDQLPYNCEHVIPQSWFAKKEPMRGDLHHLFTCESGCNSFRNNHKYYDFPDYGIREVERNECGKLVNRLFEPENNKGVVARAVLYFMLRYPSSFVDNFGYEDNDLAMLLNWHDEQPVTLYELHRNQEIFKVQGNRNPFIDFPDLYLEFNEFLKHNAGLVKAASNGEAI
jgi:endonuclease G, mitochondrial